MTYRQKKINQLLETQKFLLKTSQKLIDDAAKKMERAVVLHQEYDELDTQLKKLLADENQMLEGFKTTEGGITP